MQRSEQPPADTVPYTFAAWGELPDGEALSLSNTDLATIASLTNNIKGILQTRETIQMSIQDGSLKFVFFLPAAIAALFVSRMNAYNSGQRSTDVIPRSVLTSLDALKRQADKSNISFSFSGEGRVVLHHEALRAPNRVRNAALSQETELIGFVTDAGGASSPNIHLTNSRGSYLISASREQLAALNSNILFHYVRLAVLYKYDPLTNERKNYSLKHFISAEPVDETALSQAIAAATRAWADVTDPSEWLAKLRGEKHVSS